MNIIIAGAGKVGFRLAKTLSMGHHVTVIDRNLDTLNRLQENLDVLFIHGDIEDPATYQKLTDQSFNLFIAVTDVDEVNLISTLIVEDVVNVERKFIRLVNSNFAKSTIKEKLGITEIFFPFELTSKTVELLLKYPKANNIKHFKHTDFKLISVHASKTVEVESLDSDNFSVVGIEREKQFFVPGSTETILQNDLVYLFGAEKPILKLCDELETDVPKRIERCIVFGAGDLGVSIARVLTEGGKEVRLVDKDIKLCESAEEKLEGGVLAVSCKYGTTSIFQEEGFDYADMAIAATDNDEYNIIKCLEAKEHGIRKVVAVNNELEYYNLMHALGIIVVRGPKISAYNAIIEHIYSSAVITERIFCGGKGNIFLRMILPQSLLIGKMLKPPKTEVNEAVFLICEGRLKALDNKAEGHEGDIIVAIGPKESEAKVKNWIYGL